MKARFSLFLTGAILLSCTPLLFADEEKPPDEAFERSAFDFRFQIPESFSSTTTDRGYLQMGHNRAAYLDLTWKRESDSIVVRLFVVPASGWEKSPSEIFADAKKNMLSGSNLKLLSERDYQVGDCPAHSFVFFRQGDEPKFQRIDYFLTKPDLNIVMYSSPGKAALASNACEELFESISIKTKLAKQ